MSILAQLKKKKKDGEGTCKDRGVREGAEAGSAERVRGKG